MFGDFKVKKLFSLLSAAVVIAVLSIGTPKPAHAAPGDWVFVRICVVPGVCSGSLPWTFGPFTSYEQCMQAQYLISQGPFGQYPYGLTSCFQQ